MLKTRHLQAIINNILLVAGLLAIWIGFAPLKWGGQVSYVLVNGVSMEPVFYGGDLVIVRQSASYQVGDIVTYLDAFTGAHIIHRIIGVQNEGFILKGDNNSWIDPTRPTRDEIIGKLWIHLPKTGTAVEWVRRPVNMALTTGLIGGFLMMTTAMPETGRNARKKNKTKKPESGRFTLTLYIFALLGLGFIVLSIFTFSRPVLRNGDDIPYKHSGIFSYSAAGSPIVYDTGSASSGEPVFTKLACMLNLGFAYTLEADQVENITGFRKFYAIILDQGSGWKRTIPIAGDTGFQGNTSLSAATLDLCQVEALVTSAEKETGIHLNSYTLIIVAEVSVGGKISGQEFTDTFSPRLTFSYDSLYISLSDNNSGTDPLQAIQTGFLPNPGKEQNIFPLFGLKPTVDQMRMVAVIGLVISISVLIILGLYFNIVSRINPEATIRLKYGSLLVGIYEKGLESFSPVIEVTGMDDLAKLAERQNAMIMHLVHEQKHYYFVQIEGTTYRFISAPHKANN